MGSVSKPARKLQPKVTVATVKRNWEKKYAALSARYDELADKHIQMARIADQHRNAQENAESELQEFQDLASERLVLCHKMQGIIEYLEIKLEEANGNG